MALYGDSNLSSLTKRAATNDSYVFTAHFTTNGASAVAVDSAKTRGVVSVARTGTGVTTITLPFGLRNVSVQVTRAAGTTAQLPAASMAEGATTCTVTTVTAGGSTAADSTGIELNVRIEGTRR